MYGLIEHFKTSCLSASHYKDDAIDDMVEMLKLSGRTAHAHQAGGHERQVCETCTLTHYWASDFLRGEEIFQKPSKESCIIMADVDYYVDWAKLPVEYAGKPMMLYTFDLQDPVHSDKARSWNCKDDYVRMRVGHCEFSHQLWKYTHGDVIRLDFNQRRFFDFTQDSSYAYKVHVRQKQNSYYKFVLLEPIKKLPKQPELTQFIRRYLLCLPDAVTDLKFPTRLNFCIKGTRNEWVVLNHIDGKGKASLRFALSDSLLSYSVPLDSIVEMIHRLKLIRPDVKVQFGIDDARKREMLVEFASDLGNYVMQRYATCVNYDYAPPLEQQQQPRGGMYPLMRNILPLGVAPYSTAANEIAGISSRVQSIMHPADFKIPPNVRKAMKWFVSNIDFKAKPLSLNDVLDAQDTPSKVASITKSILSGEVDGKVEAFIKKELSEFESKPDPRIITHVNNGVKAAYLAYMMAFKKSVSMQYPFFGFGRRPDDLDRRVAEVVQNDGDLLETDFSRMDGRKSPVGRTLFELLLLRTFEDYGPSAVELHRATIGMDIHTVQGIDYTNGFSLGSGSPDTTDNNSWDTIFQLWLAKSKKIGYERAWEWIHENVLVSGDDSIAVDLDKEDFLMSTKLCGHVGKVKTCNELFCFLGRTYHRPTCHIHPVNCQDPIRALTRFTVCDRRLTTEKLVHRALFEKACAYKTTDPNTPVLSNLCSAVLRASLIEYGWRYEPMFTAANYNVLATEGRYTNEATEWMEDLWYNMESFDARAFTVYIDGANSFKAIQVHPGFCGDELPLGKLVPTRYLCDSAGVIDVLYDDTVPVPTLTHVDPLEFRKAQEQNLGDVVSIPPDAVKPPPALGASGGGPRKHDKRKTTKIKQCPKVPLGQPPPRPKTGGAKRSK